MTTLKRTLMSALAALTLGAAVNATAQEDEVIKRSFCVFDPVGANGPLFELMQSARPMALERGVELDMRAYTSEKIAAEEFRNGQCDSVLLTGTMARDFNRFTGSLEAMGAIPGEEEMRMLMQVLSQDNARQYLQTDKYEVVGVLPAGAVYLFLDDRAIDTVEDLQGKRIATLDHDKASITMVRHVGASVVGSSTSNFSGRFNNGSVDAAYAPAVAYEPLELYKGLANNGGIIRTPMIQLTFQMVIRHKRFPDGFGQKVRELAHSKMGYAMQYVHMTEKKIPEKHWVELPLREVAGMAEIMRQSRIKLRDEGVYDGMMLSIMRKIRCQRDPRHFECVDKLE